jgi:hypothetical protein
MRASSFAIHLCLAATLAGCSGGGSPPPAPVQGSEFYSELPARKSLVSGIVYDPEAFYYAFVTFPAPPDQLPPPALFLGIPYLLRTTPMEAQVSMLSGTSVASQTVSAPNGVWEVGDLPVGSDTVYQVQAKPPAAGVSFFDNPEVFPPEAFPPIPLVDYYPTTTVRPIVLSASACPLQVATLVGREGALGAVAKLLTKTKATTVADLLNPAKYGGVLLFWVYSPSPVLDVFDQPMPGIVATASRGTVYTIGWAGSDPEVPSAAGKRTEMGYYATSSATKSPLSYFAVVLPAGSTGPVTLNFTDTVTTPDGEEPGPGGPRPWSIPEVTLTPGPGVTFARLHAFPSFMPEPDPLEDPGPEEDASFLCMP